MSIGTMKDKQKREAIYGKTPAEQMQYVANRRMRRKVRLIGSNDFGSIIDKAIANVSKTVTSQMPPIADLDAVSPSNNEEAPAPEPVKKTVAKKKAAKKKATKKSTKGGQGGLRIGKEAV